MRLNDLFSKCEANGTDVVCYFKAPYYLWCNCHAPECEQDEKSDYMQMIAERGIVHERAFIEQEHPEMEPLVIETTDEVVAQLKNAIPAFDNLIIFNPEMTFAGKPDLLEISHSAPSKLGKHHYVVKEIKSVKDPTTKKYYIMQGAFYNYILGQLQEYTPDIFYIINKAGEEVPFQFSVYKDELLSALKDIQEIKKGKFLTPTLGMDYPWTDYSEKKAFETRDVSLISGISNITKQKMNSIGIHTIDDMNKVEISKITDMKGFGENKALQYKRSAEALVKGKPIIYGKHNLPTKKTEIFFDLEATMPDEELNNITTINYLFGMIVRENGKDEFMPIVAENLDEEEKIFKEFVDIVSKKDDFVIYYFSHFEKTHLNRMFDKYGADKELKTRIMENCIDLQRVVKSTVTFPTTKNGLKEIAKYLGFKWRHKDVTAQESMAWFLEFMDNGDKEKMQKIIDYNEDDCKATMIIKDWLVENIR